MSVWIYSLSSTIIVSLISLIGVLTLSFKKETLSRFSLLLVSFATGALFGDALIHLLPEAFEQLGLNLFTSLYIILGIILFFILEKFLHWRHCHLPVSKHHHHPLVTMNLVGDALHNFIDGTLIGVTYLISFPVGIATTLAIIFHEIPQEIGDFGVLIHAGLTVKKALLYNFFSAILAILGASLSLLIGSRIESYLAFFLPISAGGFLYIAGSDLIPELKHEAELKSSISQLFSLSAGVGIMVLLTLLE